VRKVAGILVTFGGLRVMLSKRNEFEGGSVSLAPGADPAREPAQAPQPWRWAGGRRRASSWGWGGSPLSPSLTVSLAGG